MEICPQSKQQIYSLKPPLHDGSMVLWHMWYLLHENTPRLRKYDFKAKGKYSPTPLLNYYFLIEKQCEWDADVIMLF
jgi:hypothetical protein